MRICWWKLSSPDRAGERQSDSSSELDLRREDHLVSRAVAPLVQIMPELGDTFMLDQAPDIDIRGLLSTAAPLNPGKTESWEFHCTLFRGSQTHGEVGAEIWGKASLRAGFSDQ